jgi:hypothetical protein
MVNSGTGHDRYPSGFPEPTWRPGATLQWRLRNYKNRLDLDRSAGRYGRAGRGHLEAAPLARELFAPAHGELQLVLLLLATGVLGLRALFQCGPVGLDGGCYAVMRSHSVFRVRPSPWRSPDRDVAAPPPSRLLPSGARFRAASRLSYSKAALRAALSSVFGGGRFFGLGRLSCGLRPALSSGRSLGQGCIFGVRVLRPDGAV